LIALVTIGSVKSTWVTWPSTFVMLMCGLLLYPRDIGGHICQAWESEE
jgi:hypothetical protein